MPRSRRPAAPAAALACLTLVLAGCSALDESSTPSSAAGSPSAGSGPAVASSSAGDGAPVAVATTTQLGSVLGDVAQCAGAASLTVMGPGDDPHDFAASSAQVSSMVEAGLVFSNGLGLEGGMESALANAEADGATLVEVAPRLDPLPFGAATAAEAAGDGHAHEHGSEDPHVWMDVARMARAAEVMGDALAEHTGEQRYAECGDTVKAQLEETDAQVEQILAAVPAGRRTLVTDHDAYGYFGEAYGFDVSGVVIPGGSTDAEPSSQELAELTAGIERTGADALVTSVAANNGLVDAVAREAGGLPVVKVYESGVGPAGTPEADYGAAMVANAHTLADALTR